MKILLDECITRRLLPYISEHIVSTVSQKGWSGLKNGKLLEKAVLENFDLLLTIDKNILYQQRIANYNIIIAVIDTPSSKIEVIRKLIPRFNELLPTFKKRNLYIIS